MWIPQQFDLRMDTAHQVMMDDITMQFINWAKSFRLPMKTATVKGLFQQHFSTCSATFQDPPFHYAYQLSSTIMDRCLGNSTFLVMDKNVRKRAVCAQRGYPFRLHQTYMCDDTNFEHVAAWHITEACSYRWAVLQSFLAREYRPKDVSPHQIPSVHLTQKGKYVMKYNPLNQNTNGTTTKIQTGLACTKDHYHAIEITADFNHLAGAIMRKTARVLRLCKLLSQEPTWTLWFPAKVIEVVKTKHSKLWKPSTLTYHGVCGKPKPQSTTARVDATPYFKDADTARGIERMTQLLQRITSQLGFRHIAVKHGRQAAGHLSDPVQRTGTGYTVIPCTTIMEAARCAAHDDIIHVEKAIMRRTRGWPMGGPFSEPMTLLDLGQSILDLHSEPNRLRECGWFCRCWLVDRIVAGVQLVDDMILMSNILCVDCLTPGAKRLVPPGVGIELEEQGESIKFLNTIIQHTPNWTNLTPYTPNTEYCMGQCNTSKGSQAGTVHRFKANTICDTETFCIDPVHGVRSDTTRRQFT